MTAVEHLGALRDLWGMTTFQCGVPLLRTAAPLLVLLLAAGCDRDPVAQDSGGEDTPLEAGACQLDLDYLFDSGVGRDGIRALSDPEFLLADHPGLTRFLGTVYRVLGFVVDDIPYAVPHNILWYHEIANVTLPDAGGALNLVVSYCPLTGSGMIFDRAAVDGAEFGVSGLLYKNNLIMYDRRTQDSLWPQMLAEARCGPERSTRLPLYPSIEMTWQGWRTLHPDTRVLGYVGSNGAYERYPYGNYEQEARFSFPMPEIDPRWPPKERVLGVREDDGGATAFPFGSLETQGAWAAIPFAIGVAQSPAVLFWDSAFRSAMAYRREVGEGTLTFTTNADGIVDVETGSRWTVEGHAVSGPLAGTRLVPVSDVFVAYWGAWYAFFPHTRVWGPAGKPGRSEPS